eukprot:scaffold4855_cov99-Cylindrotheca_fusiformis.AAC.3
MLYPLFNGPQSDIWNTKTNLHALFATLTWQVPAVQLDIKVAHKCELFSRMSPVESFLAIKTARGDG